MYPLYWFKILRSKIWQGLRGTMYQSRNITKFLARFDNTKEPRASLVERPRTLRTTYQRKSASADYNYRVFIKYCVFPLKCYFSELCQFCCSAGVLPAWCVYTH